MAKQAELTNEEREHLKKRAQENVSEARRLLNEAALLAKEGQFELSFMGATAGSALYIDDQGFDPYVWESDPERWWVPSNC